MPDDFRVTQAAALWERLRTLPRLAGIAELVAVLKGSPPPTSAPLPPAVMSAAHLGQLRASLRARQQHERDGADH